MSDLDVLRRIRAFAAGAPIPHGTTLRIRMPGPMDLRVAFVRMGGETAPWGVGWIAGNGKPAFLTIPEARDRDTVAGMMERFAPVLLAHLGHPKHAGKTPVTGTLWLAGPSHLEMLHNVAIAFRSVQKAPEPRRSTLLALSRAATWLFRESQRGGQLDVIDASAALRDHFAFPADDIRQQHLGFLLAWLGKGNRDARLAAAQLAERSSVATTLDPVLERDELEPRLDKFREAKGAARDALAAEIGKFLEVELRARLERIDAARAVLGKDPRPENPGLLELLEQATRSREQYLKAEHDLAAGKKPWLPSPLADHSPIAPARAMRWAEAYDQVAALAMVHHDADLQKEWVANGEALAGTIVKVADEGQGRSSVPVWTIDSPVHGPLKLRPGASFVVAGEEGRTGTIRSVEETAKGRRLVVEGWKKGPTKNPRPDVLPANSDQQKGRRVVLLEGGHDPIGLLFRSHFGERSGPGSWLTKKLAPTPAGDGEEVEP
jgi:hypothetical protein